MLFDQRDHEVLVRVATQKAKLLTPCNSGGLSSLETAKQRTWPSEVSASQKRSSVRPVGNHEEKSRAERNTGFSAIYGAIWYAASEFPVVREAPPFSRLVCIADEILAPFTSSDARSAPVAVHQPMHVLPQVLDEVALRLRGDRNDGDAQ